MSIEERLIRNFQDLPDDRKQEVLDFVEFLKRKEQKKIEQIMDDIISDNHEALEELSN